MIELNAAPQGFTKRRDFPQVPDRPLHAEVSDAGEVAARPHQHADSVTTSHQQACYMAANESRGTGYENHDLLPRG
jgi:hypothetical protein